MAKIIGIPGPVELLQRYTEAELYRISESSAEMGTDFRKLREVVTEYARKHDIEPPIIDWSVYIIPEVY